MPGEPVTARAAPALPLAVLGLRLQQWWLLVAASGGFADTILCPPPCAEPREPEHKVVTVPQRSPAQAVMGHLQIAGHAAHSVLVVFAVCGSNTCVAQSGY